ncbi:MAG: HD domain-containing phosphohydrolase [Spirochaetota bacterium]
MRSTILIVDDAPETIALLSEFLRTDFRTLAATTGEAALRICAGDRPPDLILLDIVMPDMDGYDLCRRLKMEPKTAEVPVIFLTSKSNMEDEQKGLGLGAVDYILKPPSPPIVLARIRTHLHVKQVSDFIRSRRDFLEREVVRRTLEIRTIQDVAMVAMGSLAETRDNETGNHIRRTQDYMSVLGDKVKDQARFKDYLSDETIDLLKKSSSLHDIGKVGIPDAILLKPGKLSLEEFEIMKTHTTLGRDAILAGEKVLDSPASFLRHSREIAWCHHEKWDGTGYPRGLREDEIPLSARLMALADVYDALISKRVYKAAFSHERAVSIIQEGAGTHFDPDIAAAFLDVSDRFREIASMNGDQGGTER